MELRTLPGAELVLPFTDAGNAPRAGRMKKKNRPVTVLSSRQNSTCGECWCPTSPFIEKGMRHFFSSSSLLHELSRDGGPGGADGR